MPKLTKSGKQSQAWKDFEREIVRRLKDAGVDAERVCRGDDLGESDVDLITPELPFLKHDCKYREELKHHSLLAGIRQKYCTEPVDQPVLHSKVRGQTGSYTTVDTTFFIELLVLAFFGNRPRRGAWACHQCGSEYTMEARAVGSLHKFTCPVCGVIVYSEVTP